MGVCVWVCVCVWSGHLPSLRQTTGTNWSDIFKLQNSYYWHKKPHVVHIMGDWLYQSCRSKQRTPNCSLRLAVIHSGSSGYHPIPRHVGGFLTLTSSAQQCVGFWLVPKDSVVNSCLMPQWQPVKHSPVRFHVHRLKSTKAPVDNKSHRLSWQNH